MDVVIAVFKVSRRTVLMATSLVFFPATLYLSLVHQVRNKSFT